MNIQQQLSTPANHAPTEAIILAGGLGTRLRSAVPNLPKCMAPVAGKPFLYHVINQLRLQGIEKIIFSLGYMHQAITDWLQQEFASLQYDFVIENEPLGTGGAIQLALQKTHTENVFVANGDTLFRFNAAEMMQLHLQNNAACTLALKPMQHFNRYGVVETNAGGIVTGFKEKQLYHSGTINAGLYLIQKTDFLNHLFPQKFSFEKDYLEKFVGQNKLYGIVQNQYFIDIGIPEDYGRAQTELAAAPLRLSAINKKWTLFLDRDGVINHDNPGGYIATPNEFRFTEAAPELFKKLAAVFHRIIIVTNQRGVGRGIINHQDLIEMNNNMCHKIAEAGGRIDKVYYCTDVDSHSFFRKPNPGMALQAVKDFPDIDFKKSLIVGNSISDMKMGRYAGMHTVFVTITNKEVVLPHQDIDLPFDGLADFANSL